MIDPRLAEIELLTLLEAEKAVTIDVPVGSTEAHYGLSSAAARGMIFHIIEEGLVNRFTGIAERMYDESTMPVYKADEDQTQVLRTFLSDRPVSLKLNHVGRLHLWRLRDEMLTNQEREKFNILWNRRAWDKAIHVQLQRASDAFPVALLMIDLDNFKKVNDKHGHPKGDLVMQSAFGLIREFTNDCAYLYGGDEIGVLVVGDEARQAHKLAGSLTLAARDNVHKEAKLKSAQTLSIGAHLFLEKTDAQTAVKKVDSLLYQAKDKGRDRVVAEGF